jgi:gas vesicle protein
MNTKTKIVLGIIGAAAAGCAIGMLLAPEKGSDLRKKIQKSASDWASSLADLIASGQEELKNLTSKATDVANDYSSQVGSTTRKVKEGMNS